MIAAVRSRLLDGCGIQAFKFPRKQIPAPGTLLAEHPKARRLNAHRSRPIRAVRIGMGNMGCPAARRKHGNIDPMRPQRTDSSPGRSGARLIDHAPFNKARLIAVEHPLMIARRSRRSRSSTLDVTRPAPEAAAPDPIGLQMPTALRMVAFRIVISLSTRETTRRPVPPKAFPSFEVRSGTGLIDPDLSDREQLITV